MDNEERFRNRVIWFSGIMSILVIWTHTINSELFLGDAGVYGTIASIEVIISEVLCQVAVPGFFLLSSYLFFRNYDISKIWSKWESRVRSLLIPFFLWNFIYYVGYVIASRLPWLANVVGKGSVRLEAGVLVKAIVSFTYNPTFWFVYQLILLVIVSPIIYMLMRYKPIACVILALEAVILCFNLRLPLINADALFYFTVGAVVALHMKKQAESDGGSVRIILGIVLMIVGYLLYAVETRTGIVFLVVLGRTLVPIGIWMIISSTKGTKPLQIFENSFFTYAIHFAIVRLINKSMATLAPGSGAVALVLFFVMPIIVLFISYGLASFLKNHLNPVYTLLSGGR